MVNKTTGKGKTRFGKRIKMFEININDNIYVKLTANGEETYRQYFVRLRMDPIPIRRDSEGWCEFSLWELMNIFGHQCYMGGDNQFVENRARFNLSR